MLYWILCLFYFDEANTESELAMGIIKGLRIGLKMLDGILIPYHREEALKFPKISTFQKVTISEVSYIIYLYKGESKTFSSKIEFLL